MLLEVALAAAMLAGVLGALIIGLSRCVAAAQSVQNYAIAQRLLANKSYEFRVERSEDTLDQEGTFEGEIGYSWSRRLEATDEEGLWKQTITVAWYERGQLKTDEVVEYRHLPNKQP
jgi:hypothetical protein